MGAPAILFALIGCDSGATARTGVLVDDDLVAANPAVTFDALSIASKADIRFDWSEISEDWLGNPFSPSEVAMVEFISPDHAAAPAFAVSLLRDAVTAADVGLYGWFYPTEGETSVAVTGLSDRSPAIVPEEHLVESRVWLLLLRDSHERIRVMASIAPSDAVEPATKLAIPASAAALGTAFDVAAGPPVLLDPDAVLDWSKLTIAADGAVFDAGRISRMRAAALDSAWSGNVEWSALDADLAEDEGVETGSTTSVDLPDAIVSGSAGDSFVVALDCVDCEPILPGAVFIVERN